MTTSLRLPNLRTLALCLTAGAFSGPLAAQTTAPAAAHQLDTVVVSATRTDRLIDETPGTVVAVTLNADPLDDFASVVKQQPLADAPFQAFGADSFIPYQRGGNLGYNLRGIEGNRVLIQVDGVRAPDEFTLGGSEPTGRDYLETELLQLAEILQGSASALYGTDALGGVVTFTSKDPASFLDGRPFGLAYKGAYASVSDTLSHTVTGATAVGPLSALVVFNRRDGHEAENNGSVSPNPADLTSDAVLAKLVWSPAAAHRLAFTAEHLDRTFAVDIDNAEGNQGFAGTIAEVHTDSDTERFRLGLDYRFTPAAPTAFADTLTASLYTQDAVARDRNLQVRTLPSSRIRDTETAFHNDSVGGALHVVKSLPSDRVSHRLAYGAEASRTATGKSFERLETTTSDVSTDAPRMADTDTTRAGLYLQDEIEWTLSAERSLVLIPGLRLDRFELEPDNSAAYLATTGGQPAPGFSDTALAPKFAALVGVTDSLNAYAQYNRGYRYPSAEELTATFTNVAFGYKTIPNPDLQPETSDSFELGLKGDLTPALNLRAAVFTNTYADFIEQFLATAAFDPAFPAGVFQTRNAAEARIRGVDISLALDGGELTSALAGWTASAAVGWSKGRVRDAGAAWRPLDSIAPWQANASLAYRAASGHWGAALALEHAAAKDADEIDGDPTTRFLTPAYTTLDLTAWWRLNERLSLTAGFYNLTDEKYWRYNSVRGVSATNTAQLERRTEAGFNSAFSLQFRY